MTDLRLLALDAATETVHLALVDGDRRSTLALSGGAQASATLLPAIQRLLADHGLVPAQLQAIAFGRGPGAFTGLRSACAVAQGLALGLARPLLALDTLAAVAESAWQRGGVERVWTALDARMGEIYAARWWRAGPGDWRAERAAALFSPGSLAEAIAAEPALLAGNALALPEMQAALQATAGAATALPGWPEAAPDGAALAALAQAAWARGERLDPALALPLYVRDKVAQTTAEREATRRAAASEVPA
jgi:tRNA threonylcarbamoyladenosine biosynthesis protein TsaB